MCEKVIKDRWVKYLENNRILKNSQFGFREGQPCVTDLISFYSRVIDIGTGKGRLGRLRVPPRVSVGSNHVCNIYK